MTVKKIEFDDAKPCYPKIMFLLVGLELASPPLTDNAFFNVSQIVIEKKLTWKWITYPKRTKKSESKREECV